MKITRKQIRSLIEEVLNEEYTQPDPTEERVSGPLKWTAGTLQGAKMTVYGNEADNGRIELTLPSGVLVAVKIDNNGYANISAAGASRGQDELVHIDHLPPAVAIMLKETLEGYNETFGYEVAEGWDQSTYNSPADWMREKDEETFEKLNSESDVEVMPTQASGRL